MGKPWVVLLLLAGAAWADNATVYAPDEACAYFKIYQDEALTKEVGSPLGGVVYPVLYIRLGPGWEVDSNVGSVAVKVTDNYPNYQAGTNVTKALDTVLMTCEGWEMKAQSSRDWVSSAGPGAGSVPLQEPVFYRFKLTWDSTKEPLGNNGKHTLSGLPNDGQDGAPPGVRFVDSYCTTVVNGPAAKVVTTENCWISDVKCSNGTIDYFLWEPQGNDALAHPKLSFTIKDADPHSYKWLLFYRPTSSDEPEPAETAEASNGFTVMSGVVPTGGDRRVPIDLTDPARPGHLTYDGDSPPLGCPYTYEIRVYEYDGAPPGEGIAEALDQYALKKGCTLDVGPAADGQQFDEIGHSVWFARANSGLEVRCAYSLTDREGAAADPMQLTVFDGELRATVLPPEQNQAPGRYGTPESDQPNGITVCQVPATAPAGIWRVMFSPVDTTGRSAADRRTHDGRHMIAVNGGAKRKQIALHYGVYAYNPSKPDDVDDFGLQARGAAEGLLATAAPTAGRVKPPYNATAAEGRAAYEYPATHAYFMAGHRATEYGSQEYGVARKYSDLHVRRSHVSHTGVPFGPPEAGRDGEGTVYHYMDHGKDRLPNLGHLDLLFLAGCNMLTRGGNSLERVACAQGADQAVGFDGPGVGGCYPPAQADFFRWFWADYGVQIAPASSTPADRWVSGNAHRSMTYAVCMNRLTWKDYPLILRNPENIRYWRAGLSEPMRVDPSRYGWE